MSQIVQSAYLKTLFGHNNTGVQSTNQREMRTGIKKGTLSTYNHGNM